MWIGKIVTMSYGYSLQFRQRRPQLHLAILKTFSRTVFLNVSKLSTPYYLIT